MRRGLHTEGGGAVLEIPLSIFSNSLSSLESITKFMKEDLGYSYAEIATTLKRDPRTIWGTYSRIQTKPAPESESSSSSLTFPVSVLQDRTLGVLEALVVFLREEHGLRYAQIATILHRDNRTIWTAYSRARRKRDA